jgi:hypothetical protein
MHRFFLAILLRQIGQIFHNHSTANPPQRSIRRTRTVHSPIFRIAHQILHQPTQQRKVMKMNKQLLVLSFGIGIAFFALKPAQAQTTPCATHEAIVAHLASEFGETRQSIGLAADNSVVEVFASEETGSWTITMTTADGPTCLVAAGQAFQNEHNALPNFDPEA